MRRTDLEKHVGKVVTLDLISGLQVTTFIEGLTPDGDAVNCRELMIFELQLAPKNPALPPHPQDNPIVGNVRNRPYGPPLYEAVKKITIDAAHIMFVHTPAEEMKSAYMRATSGLVLAGAGTLDNLPPLRTEIS